VSAALGSDGQAYRVSGWGAGLRAWSPAQELSTSFTRSGVSVRSGTTHVGFSLLGVGYGSMLAPVGQVAPSAHANRVVYRRSGLSEWYANGPLGLEQGFTIPRAPGGYPTGPLTLSIALSGNARASLANGGQGITLDRAGKTVLRYTGLTATDAREHLLRSWLQLDGRRLILRVDAHRARYPLRIDPFIQQSEKLTGSEEIGEGGFGDSVALSGDGNTALIGGAGDNGGVGAAWVFTRSGSTWTQQGSKLTGSGEVSTPGYPGGFGWSVALSGNGNTALIGGVNDNGGVGAAWVFTRSGSTWTQQGSKLTGSEESGPSEFGWDVALSGDGNTALIGGSSDNSEVGAAWVFTRSGSAWTQGAKLTGSEESQRGRFGFSVALSSDGNTAVVGGPHDGNGPGAAWVFTRSSSAWTQQGSKLTGSEEVAACCGSEFGTSVALSSDGNTALVGGRRDNGGVGAAWVFARSGSTWTQQGSKLTGSSATETGNLGLSVGLSADGNTALIGGFTATGAGAWVFTRSGSTWTQQGGSFTGTGWNSGCSLCFSVALSDDGNTALVGSSYDTKGVGAAWVFTSQSGLPPPPPSGIPLNTSPPVITGNPVIGQTLSCSPGVWSGDTPQSFSYSWIRSGYGVLPRPSTDPHYTVTSADQGYGIVCEVTATNAVGSDSAESRPLMIPGVYVPPPLSEQPIYQAVFVHGIRASCAKTGAGDYRSLYDALDAQHTDVLTFCYDHDEAFGGKHPEPTPTRCFSTQTSRGGSSGVLGSTVARESPVGGKIGPLHVESNQGDASEAYDGNSALAYDAAKLDDCLSALVQYDITRYKHPVPIAVIGNSMGGAITRGWMQLAKYRHSTALSGVTTVFFLEAATQGSWIAKLGQGADSGLSELFGGGVPGWIADQWGGALLGDIANVDFRRAGVKDLAPQSGWYRSIVASGTPPKLHYFTLSVDQHIHFKEQLVLWQVQVAESDALGDGVMQLGSTSFSALPG
jgi:hypothetical protein